MGWGCPSQAPILPPSRGAPRACPLAVVAPWFSNPSGTLSGLQGSHCEQCLPLFVGSAVGGGTCRPCHSFCRGNSHVCVSRKELEMARREPEKFSLDPEEVKGAGGRSPGSEGEVPGPCLFVITLSFLG